MNRTKVIEWILAHLPVHIPPQYLEKVVPLNPRFHGNDCSYNGENPGIKCGCDECDYYLEYFPDWQEYWI